jgi:hypothetical protein
MKTLLLITLCVIACQALNCNTYHDCDSVAENEQFVDCVGGTCQCIFLTDGSATLESPCSCTFPKQAQYSQVLNRLFCISPDGPEVKYQTEYQIAQTIDFFNAALYTNNPGAISAGNFLWNIVNPNAYGRWNSFATTHDSETLQQLFFGLSAASNATSYQFLSLTSASNIVSFHIQYVTNEVPSPITDVILKGDFYFGPDGRIAAIDATYVNLGIRNNVDLLNPFNIPSATNPIPGAGFVYLFVSNICFLDLVHVTLLLLYVLELIQSIQVSNLVLPLYKVLNSVLEVMMKLLLNQQLQLLVWLQWQIW